MTVSRRRKGNGRSLKKNIGCQKKVKLQLAATIYFLCVMADIYQKIIRPVDILPNLLCQILFLFENFVFVMSAGLTQYYLYSFFFRARPRSQKTHFSFAGSVRPVRKTYFSFAGTAQHVVKIVSHLPVWAGTGLGLGPGPCRLLIEMHKLASVYILLTIDGFLFA